MVNLIKKFFIFILLIFGSLFVLDVAKAENITIHFEDYTLGDLDGQNGWSVYNDYATIDETDDNQYIHLTPAVRSLNYAVVAQKVFPAVASTSEFILKFRIRQNYENGRTTELRLYSDDITSGEKIIFYSPSGQNYFFATDNTYVDRGYHMLESQFHYITVKINNATGERFVSVDNQAFFQLTDGGTNKSQDLFYVEHNPENIASVASDSYFDDIVWDYEQFSGNVVIEEIPEWVGNIQIGSETIIQYNRNNFCFLNINQPCYLKFNYGYDSIGSNIYLLDQSFNIIATSTISEDQLLLQDRFLIPEPEGEETQLYCIAMENDEETKTWCDISLEWVNNEWCDEDLVCADVATSSDFLYGFQCGFRKGVCWLFTPTTESIDFFTKSVDNFTNSFPFNLAFGLIDEAETAIASSSGGASFGVPMYSATTSSYYTLTGIDQYTYQEILGTSTISTLETQADIIVYLVFGLAIAFIVYKSAIVKE